MLQILPWNRGKKNASERPNPIHVHFGYDKQILGRGGKNLSNCLRFEQLIYRDKRLINIYTQKLKLTQSFHLVSIIGYKKKDILISLGKVAIISNRRITNGCTLPMNTTGLRSNLSHWPYLSHFCHGQGMSQRICVKGRLRTLSTQISGIPRMLLSLACQAVWSKASLTSLHPVQSLFCTTFSLWRRLWSLHLAASERCSEFLLCFQHAGPTVKVLFAEEAPCASWWSAVLQNMNLIAFSGWGNLKPKQPQWQALVLTQQDILWGEFLHQSKKLSEKEGEYRRSR